MKETTQTASLKQNQTVYIFTMNRYGITPLEDYMLILLTGLGVHVRFLDGMLSAAGDTGPHCNTNENRNPVWWK